MKDKHENQTFYRVLKILIHLLKNILRKIILDYYGHKQTIMQSSLTLMHSLKYQTFNFFFNVNTVKITLTDRYRA